MTPVPPLTPEQLRALVEAGRCARKVRRGAAVARFGGWTGAVFAVLTLLAALVSFSWSTLGVGIGLAAVAAGELHGAALLSRLDARGPRRLAINQALLAAVLCGYAGWCLFSGPPPLPAEVVSADPALADLTARMVRLVHLALYGTLLLFGMGAPALTAWFYLSRAPHLARLHQSHDPGVVQVLKAA